MAMVFTVQGLGIQRCGTDTLQMKFELTGPVHDSASSSCLDEEVEEEE